MSLRDDLGKLEVPKMVVWIDKDIKVETTHLTEKTINEVIALILKKLPEKKDFSTEAADEWENASWVGFNRALSDVRSILEEK